METKERIIMARPLRRPLPKSWNEMAGVFKHKRKALEQHAKKIRREWEKKAK
jgi:hypothetical protein